jgi:predicted ATPase
MEELQVEPSNTAKQVFEQILASEPILALPNIPQSSRPTSLEPSRDPLIGRDAELAQLDEEIHHLFAGHGNLVMIAGENGLGKSRLITEGADRAAKRGAITMWSAAYRSRQSHPYHLFSVLLDGFALRIPPENLHDLLGSSGNVLAAIAPSLARALDLDDNGSPDMPDDRHIASAMLDFFAQLTRFAPVAIVLDNLHLADDASLRLIGDLADLLHDMPVLLLTAYCDTEIIKDSPLDTLHRKVQDGNLATVLRLTTISVSDTERLAARILGGVVDGPVVETIYRVAAGNLHYTREAIEALEGRKRIVQKLGTWQLRSGIAVTWGRDQLRAKPESGDFQLVRLLRA